MSDSERGSTAAADDLQRVFSESPLDFDGTDFCRTLVSNAAEGMLTIDEAGTIVFANPALERILGYSPADLVGEPLLTLIPDRLVDDHRRAFQRYLATGDRRMSWDDVELVALHRAGHEVDVSISFREHRHAGNRLFTGILTDISEQKRRETELERYEDIINHLPEGIYRTEAKPGGTFLEANPALRDILDVPTMDALLQQGPDDFYADPNERETLREELHTEGELTDQELQIETAAGEIKWLSVTAIPRSEDGDTYIDGIVSDITERRRRERELRERQQSIEAALERLPGIVFTIDEDGIFTRSEGETLEKVGLEPGEAVGESVDELYAEHPEIPDACRRALDGETINDTVEVAGRVFEVTYRPVTHEGDVTGVVGFAYDVTDRKERERTLERQQNALQRVKQLTDSLRPLNRALAQVSTRDAVERVVCEQLAASDTYQFAWYGDYDPATDRVIPQEWAGTDSRNFDDAVVPTDGAASSPQPVSRAVHTRDVQAAQNIATDSSAAPWHDDILLHEGRSAAAIPVSYSGSLYGVITVYADRPEAFDDYERGLLRELGTRIGHVVHAAETERLLHTNTVVELEFQTTGGESPLVRMTDELGCRLELETVVPASENSYLCFANVERAPPEDAVAFLTASRVVEHARVTDSAGDTGTIVYRIRESPAMTLLAYGATVASHVVEDGTATVVGEVTPDADIQRIIDGVEDSFPTTSFAAKRSVDRPVRSLTVTQDALGEILTDRQSEVLELAYRAGFFESPKASTGEELADALDITSATFYLHVRTATQKLLEEMDRMDLF